jgi:hypothetical protein
MKPVHLASFSNWTDAVLIQQRLQQAGIPAHVRRTFWYTLENTGAIKLAVNKDKWGVARALLQEWAVTSRPLQNALRCPECHSFRVQYPQLGRKFISLSLIARILPFFEKEFYCQDCHFIWPKNPSHITRGIDERLGHQEKIA